MPASRPERSESDRTNTESDGRNPQCPLGCDHCRGAACGHQHPQEHRWDHKTERRPKRKTLLRSIGSELDPALTEFSAQHRKRSDHTGNEPERAECDITTCEENTRRSYRPKREGGASQCQHQWRTHKDGDSANDPENPQRKGGSHTAIERVHGLAYGNRSDDPSNPSRP